MRLLVLATTAFCVLNLAAHADTVYNYVGQDFQYADGSFNTTDKVTGSFTVADPIGADYSGNVDVTSFSFSDGVQTLNKVNMPRYVFNFTTDANGQIIYYDITINEPTLEPAIWIQREIAETQETTVETSYRAAMAPKLRFTYPGSSQNKAPHQPASHPSPPASPCSGQAC